MSSWVVKSPLCYNILTVLWRVVFSRHVLQMHDASGVGEIGTVSLKLAVFLFLSWLLIFFCLRKGVKSSGKVSFPIVFLNILALHSDKVHKTNSVPVACDCSKSNYKSFVISVCEYLEYIDARYYIWHIIIYIINTTVQFIVSVSFMNIVYNYLCSMGPYITIKR